MPKRIGVVIGRFQVPELHPGHKLLLYKVMLESDQLCVLIGTQPYFDKKNPLSYSMREEMISEEFPTAVITELPDIRNSDNPKLGDIHWSNSIDKLCNTIYPSSHCTLYGGRDSFINYYYGNMSTTILEFNHNHKEWSGTYQRKVLERGAYRGASFRAGIILGVTQTLRRLNC